jgi:predicted helicase
MEPFSINLITKTAYRPFVSPFLYDSKIFVDERGILKTLDKGDNTIIALSGRGSSKQFQALATKQPPSYDLLEKTQCFPLYRYDKDGNRTENITDWGLAQFQKHYKTKKITKEDIFHYTYAVLHNPAYRAKYALNLKREFPRLPFYADFGQWAAWGKTLMELHTCYETAAPFPLMQTDMAQAGTVPKVKLKADKDAGSITLDDVSTLSGIPAEAWDYKLGNRSALEWVLDQYKESKPKDPTIAARFNTYRFADYKDHVVELLKKVCTVSVETMRIVGAMRTVGE